METDQMALILQELRAIKQNQEEMKKDSDSVKRRQSYLMHYTKAISCKLEDVIDSEIEAFSLPFSTPESVQKMEQNLNQRRYSEKLVSMTVSALNNLLVTSKLLNCCFTFHEIPNPSKS